MTGSMRPLEEEPRQGIVLAKDGVWLVPVSRRPAGWESMGLREPEDKRARANAAAARFVSGSGSRQASLG